MMLRMSHCLDNQLTDDGVVSLKHWACSAPLKHYFPASCMNNKILRKLNTNLYKVTDRSFDYRLQLSCHV
jgi:hypothetical protein